MRTHPAARSVWRGNGTLVDRLSGAPNVAFSLYRKLRAAQTNAFRVRRASDGTTQDIGFAGDFVDWPAVATFCSGTTGTLNIIYDQSGNGRNITQGTSGAQATLYSSGDAQRNSSRVPAASFDGTDDTMLRGDSCGMSGTAAFTACAVSDTTQAGFGDVFCWGAAAALPTPSELQFAHSSASQMHANLAGRRIQFNHTSGIRAYPRTVIMQKAASAAINAITCEIDGAQATVGLADTDTVNIGTTGFALGATLSATLFLAQKLVFIAGFASVVSGNDLIFLRDEMRFHCLAPRAVAR